MATNESKVYCTWTEAQFFCRALGADLASFHHYEEQAFVRKLLSMMFQRCGVEHELWVFFRGAEYYFAIGLMDPLWIVRTGKMVNFTQSLAKTVSRCHLNMCLFLHLPTRPEDGKTWQHAQSICSFCQGSLVFIEDEIEQDITKRPTQSYYTASSLDSSDYKNHSYHIIHGNLSWYQAQKTCLEKGAALVSITDPFQQTYLTALINRLEAPHWIGLYSTDKALLSPMKWYVQRPGYSAMQLSDLYDPPIQGELLL
ncbi:hypothetical protein cypCar_00043115 [Cyprinus carpio]|nr:hypothetical protein cypCar_00043115 [Cyprinus carpio]